ncbi:MAG: penicillin-binding protein [Bryobacterales bacterium]|nr:penicillin-binding protein [Bryobacterales bacterium]
MINLSRFALILFAFILLGGVASAPAHAASTVKKSAGVKKARSVAKAKPAARKSTAVKRATASRKRTTTAAKKSTRPAAAAKSTAAVSRSRSRRARARYSPWITPTYADPTSGDATEGDDPVVRRAAVEALGRLNGAVVVADPNTGRILSMVNQSTALSSGYIPCSTVKIPVAMAGLYEGMIDSSTTLVVQRRTKMDLTEALAKSNNTFFERVGSQLGFDKLIEFHKYFGLGEKAGLNIDGESPGILPEAPPQNGGAARMSSFGEGIAVTALQMTALMGAIANGGTLYYLQYPKNELEIETFVPRVKRALDISHILTDLKRGMSGAVSFGTARQAAYTPEAPLFGKTGTCTDHNQRAHMGWFASFRDGDQNDLVVVVMLTGADGVSGPRASGVAGRIYEKLESEGFFAKPLHYSPVAMIENSIPNVN